MSFSRQVDNYDSQPNTIDFSTIVLAWRLFLLIFVVDTFFAVLFIFYGLLNPPSQFDSTFIQVLWLLHTLKFLVLGYLILRTASYWAERRVFFTGTHLVVRTGIWRKKEQLYELSQLRSVTSHQSWLGKRLNYGNLICLFTASGFSEELRLIGIAWPTQYEHQLEGYLDSA